MKCIDYISAMIVILMVVIMGSMGFSIGYDYFHGINWVATPSDSMFVSFCHIFNGAH